VLLVKFVMWIAAWEKINLPHRNEEVLVQTAGHLAVFELHHCGAASDAYPYSTSLNTAHSPRLRACFQQQGHEREVLHYSKTI
jgi:hypothetical protein